MDDKTKATALKLAQCKLIARGWKFTPSDIGEVAADIINAMNNKLESK